ncbi:hypothetical protein BT96DRAFT_983545 [Gymnopus androsaceus JB14]|uniref:Uncharacterized protein n=1 Tax=Gymnopus androsaceus JB14 TaxID=1447944 RepID=A0A6A4IN33_9AGAR|nr:hypothetical protein BT96DRAFT_983545 [Gymnopus androsaceus JB14]
MLLAFFLLFLLQFTTAEVQSFAVSGSVLTFSPGWQSTSSEAAGPFSFTNTLGLALTINLPLSTTSISYVGLKTTGGSIYGVCLDCTTSTFNLQEFSGRDATLLSNSDAVPTTIFSLDVNPDEEHVLQISNIADGAESELTFVSLILEKGGSSTTVGDPLVTAISSTSITSSSSTSTVASSTTSTSTTVSSTTSSITATSSSIPSASATAAPASASSNTSAKSSLIAIITILTLIAVLSPLVGLFFYLRNRPRNPASFEDLTTIQDTSTMKQAALGELSTPTSAGPLATAGRKKPPTRLLDPTPYPPFVVPRDAPILPVRRLESG